MVVLVVWGIVGYKIMITIHPKKAIPDMVDFSSSFNPVYEQKVDTFSISMVNRDPFLGTLMVKKKALNKSIKKNRLEWIPLEYHGTISKGKDQTTLFIISVNGKQYIFKKGQVIEEVKLIRGTKSSVLVSYKKERKTFKKT